MLNWQSAQLLFSKLTQKLNNEITNSVLHIPLLFIDSIGVLLEAFRSSLKLVSGVPLVTPAGGMH